MSVSKPSVPSTRYIIFYVCWAFWFLFFIMLLNCIVFLTLAGIGSFIIPFDTLTFDGLFTEFGLYTMYFNSFLFSFRFVSIFTILLNYNSSEAIFLWCMIWGAARRWLLMFETVFNCRLSASTAFDFWTFHSLDTSLEFFIDGYFVLRAWIVS